MRILVITDQFPPTHFGGMAQHAWHISHYLASRHNVQVLLPFKEAVDLDNIPFEVVPRLTMKFPRIDAIRSLSTAKTFRPDVIHVCTAGLGYSSLYRHYPIVTRVVGNDFLRPWRGGNLLLRSLWYRMPSERFRRYIRARETAFRKRKVNHQLYNSRIVVANSDWTRHRLIEEGIPEEYIKTIVGGLDTETFQPPVNKKQVRRDLRLPEDGPILLTAANLVMKKGIDTVLYAVSELAVRWPLLRYVIVGDGKDEAYLKNLANKLKLCDRVIFAGRKTQADLSRYYQAADIYVQVSRGHKIQPVYVDVETMGRTYFEAGACGIPVIASNTGGISSVVRDNANGLLAEDPVDCEETGRKIDILLCDKVLRARLGAEGLRRAREEFCWKRVGAAFEELMMSCVANTQRQRLSVAKKER